MKRDDLPERTFTDEAIEILRHYQWPGNIRELRNLVQRLLILGTEKVVQGTDVRRALGTATRIADSGKPFVIGQDVMDMPLRQAREVFEHDYLLYQWNQSGHSVSRLARKIGMERTHLYRKLKSLGIDHKRPATEQ